MGHYGTGLYFTQDTTLKFKSLSNPPNSHGTKSTLFFRNPVIHILDQTSSSSPLSEKAAYFFTNGPPSTTSFDFTTPPFPSLASHKSTGFVPGKLTAGYSKMLGFPNERWGYSGFKSWPFLVPLRSISGEKSPSAWTCCPHRFGDMLVAHLQPPRLSSFLFFLWDFIGQWHVILFQLKKHADIWGFPKIEVPANHPF